MYVMSLLFFEVSLYLQQTCLFVTISNNFYFYKYQLLQVTQQHYNNIITTFLNTEATEQLVHHYDLLHMLFCRDCAD